MLKYYYYYIMYITIILLLYYNICYYYYYALWNKIFQTVFYGILHPKDINKNPLPDPVP